MNKFTLFFATLFLLLCISSLAQDKKQDKIASMQLKVDQADALIFSADSLIEVGTNMMKETEIELKALAAEEKNLNRDYFNAKKPLEKQLRSRDKEEVAQAKAELKQVEDQYKADMKDWNNRYKVAIKNYDGGAKLVQKGKANLSKAKDKKKGAEKALKDAEKAAKK